MWPQKQFLKISKFGDLFSEETGTFRFIFLFFAFWRKKNAGSHIHGDICKWI